MADADRLPEDRTGPAGRPRRRRLRWTADQGGPMTRGKAFGLALAGAGFLAAAPAAARADEDADLQDRIRQLESQVQELRQQIGTRPADDSLSEQVDRYLQEKEK